MSKIKKLKKKHRVLRWLKKLLGIQSPTEPRNWPYDIDEVHELVDIEAERARVLQATSRKVGSITLGVEVKNCRECERGDCTQCCYKQEFERLIDYKSCHSCSQTKSCEHAPEVGGTIRINCIKWSPKNGMEAANNAT